MRLGLRGLAAIGFAAGTLAITATPAGAVTIGQVGPPLGGGCSLNDFLQPMVLGGASYVVPPGGTAITSWSTNAISSPGEKMTLKVFRKTPDPTMFTVVAHDPRDLSPGVLNTFSVNIPVKPGDILGLHEASSMAACAFRVNPSPDTFLGGSPLSDLGDGQTGTFMTFSNNTRLNISAEVTTVGGQRAAALKKCKKKHSKKKRKKCRKKANLLPA